MKREGNSFGFTWWTGFFLTLFCPLLMTLAQARSLGRPGPDQVLLVVNTGNTVACAIATDYASKRHIKTYCPFKAKIRR